jgi:hypothetical protein
VTAALVALAHVAGCLHLAADERVDLPTPDAPISAIV